MADPGGALSGRSGELGHVRWLGGSACAGKTSVARRLAGRYALALYSCDERWEEHCRRVDPGRHPCFDRLRRRSTEELFLRPVTEQVAELLGFYREQLAMIVDDLRALPRRPTLVEGAGLLPSLVDPLCPGPRHALFLVATPELRRRLYPERGPWVARLLAEVGDPERAFRQWMERDDEKARRVVEEAAELGLEAVAIDGTVDVEGVAARAAAWFGWGPAQRPLSSAG